MSTTLTGTPENVVELVEFLEQEIVRQSLPVVLYADDVVPLGRQLKVPAFVEGNYDAYDKATMLQKIEDAWNDRYPEPGLIATLVPVTKLRPTIR